VSSSNSQPERFERTALLYGENGFANIRAASVMIIGLGGVGTHGAIALARSGIGRIVLVDFDTITASSLNRHPCARPEDVGRSKTTVLAEFLRATCPDTEVVERQMFFHDDTADELLDPPPTQVLDAIDSLNPKVSLLHLCLDRGVPVTSSMGAAMHVDASLVRIADISETTICPLASNVRKKLRRRGHSTGVRCVYSLEKHTARPLPPNDDPSYDRGRVRNTLPSSMSIPAVFGFALASDILNRVAAADSD
jgi:tRNA threonylcarbamoyladenosine dehydratase